MVKIRRRRKGLLRKKKAIWVEQINNSDPQPDKLLAGLFSMTIQQIHKERKDKTLVDAYERAFDTVVEQAEIDLGEVTPEIMQDLVIQHFNRYSHRSRIVVEPVVYHNVYGFPDVYK